jgi:hypothetical protein
VRKGAADRLHPLAMLSTLTAWVIIWPFSMVENLAGDVINMIRTAISTVFRSVYNRIYESAVRDLLPTPVDGTEV